MDHSSEDPQLEPVPTDAEQLAADLRKLADEIEQVRPREEEVQA